MSDEQRTGLIGGDLERRLEHARVPPLDFPAVLAPFRREGDDEVLRNFVQHPRVHIEIGFARGHHIGGLATQFPDDRILGFEIRRQWVRQVAKRAGRDGFENLKVVEGDCRPLMERLVPPNSISHIYALFPDPWWKKKHHKRRLFQPETLRLLHSALKPGGDLVVKTDVPAYADLIDEIMNDLPGWTLAGSSAEDPILAALPQSHREKKCLTLGIPAFWFRFVKESPDEGNQS